MNKRFLTLSKSIVALIAIVISLFTTNLQAQTTPAIVCPPDAAIACDESTDPANTGMAMMTGDCLPTPEVWINEIHYDNGNPGNNGADVGEFIEIAGTAGFDLSTCQLYFYNGSSGNTYGGSGGFRTLSGMIDDEGMGYGAVSFDIAALSISSIQNGAPDGLALACNGTLVQFISYEGSFVAAGNTGYPAFGMTSTDIGVAEDSSTPIGFSLQLNGTGNTNGDFSWIAPSAESPGTLNAGQNITGSVPEMTFSDAGGPGLAACDPYTYTITRTWTATFTCGDQLSCDQMISVSDNTPPVITCPVDVVLECGASTDPADTGMATATDNCTGLEPPSVWINEFHYDNDGTDINEFVEVAGTAGFDLSNCFIYLYNGSSGNLYNSNPPHAFTGTIPDEGNGYGAVSINISPIQNGVNTNGTDADGLALVCNGQVVQFLSYEGSFVAGNGPAAGMTSQDVGVAELGGDAPGLSLQLGGTGSNYGSFSWTGPTAQSPGTLNAGQNMTPPESLIVITFADAGGPGTTACSTVSYTIERTWTATDACGNATDCVQTITFEDNTPPVIETCPANVSIDCSESTDPANTGMPVATDNCSAEPSVWINEFHYDNDGADVNEFVEVAGTAGFDLSNCAIYLYNGSSGNLYNSNPPNALSGTIPNEGNGYGAVFINITPIQNGMNTAGTDADGLALVCNGTVVQFLSYEGSITAGNGPAAGMTSQDIGVSEPSNNPVGFSLQLQGTGSSYDAFTWAAPSVESPGLLNANQIVNNGVTITSSDVSTQGMACSEFSYTITRTWVATDVCDNSTSCTQVITVEDNTPPTITCPPNVTVECDQATDPAATGMATATADNCATEAQLTIVFSDESTQTPMGCTNDSYTITRTWTASDPCGNTATCVQIITVEDTTPATIICPANVTIECDEDTSPTNTGEAVAVDDCAPEAEIVITFVDASTQGTTGCEQYQYTITRTWTATDPCGNAATCTQTINVEDTTAPSIVCPADISLSCTDSSDPGNTGIATGSDNCSAGLEVIITSSDITTQGTEGCSQFSFEILRTWLATDACGNTSTCVQSISVADTEAPVVTCPPSQTLTCFETIPTPFTTAADFIAAGGTISDNCTSALTDFTVFAQNDDNGGDNCPGNAQTVVRTYFIADACGNTSTCQQTFTYLESTQGPVITSILPTCFKYCASLANPMEADITYETDCSFGATVNITGPTQIGQDNCPGSIYRYTYTVTDDCGRTSAPVTRDFIIGNDGPTIEAPAFNLFLECGDVNNADYFAAHVALVTANTSCGLGENINYFPQNINFNACASSTVVTFVVTDDCGRTASATTTVSVQDNTAPEITSVYVDGICNEAVCGSNLNFWFNEWKDKVLEDLSATDNCDTNVTFTTQGPSSPNQNCPDETTETVIQFVANDNCGNTAYLEYSFYVTAVDAPEPTSSVTGNIHTESMEAVADVEVNLSGGLNFYEQFVTGSDGDYVFENLALQQNYQLSPYHNQFPLNGVSSYDLILIAQHILDINPLDSPYKMIAADINKSGSITTLDLVELRKMILFVNTEFSDNTSWRFVAADYVFPDATNPFVTVFPELLNINNLVEPITHDFIGVKIGDVNESAVPNDLTEADDRSFNGSLLLEVDDQELYAGKTYEISFRTNHFDNMQGYQFTLDFDQTALSLQQMTAKALPNLNESNFGFALLDEGVITSSWTNISPVSLASDSDLFQLTFVAQKDTRLSEVLSLSSRYTKSEAYNAELDLMDVQLNFESKNNPTTVFRLHQNKPNPFAQNTLIGFDLPKAMSLNVAIYDLEGRELKRIAGDFEKGYNEVSISKSDLGVSGVLYYRLLGKGVVAVRKMIVVE